MLDTSLVLAQRQQLKLNVQMLQSLEMMTLPLSELRAKIEDEAEKNPTLSLSENESNSMSYEEYASKYQSSDRVKDDYSDSAAYGSDLSDSHQAWLEGAVADEETLEDHLNMQLGCVKCSAEVRHVAEVIISSLDSNGFFTKAPQTLLKESEKPYLEEALNILHSLDPSGIACANSRESLIIQAENLGIKGEERNSFIKLVNNELEKMRAGKYAEVEKDLKIDEEELMALYSFLKTLTPFPGAKFKSGYENYIIPDLSIKKEDGKLVLRVNTSELPILSVDPEYKEMLKECSASKQKDEKEAAKYLKGEIQSAESLINQVNMRNTTLEKTGQVLLAKQKAFFLFGPQSLKPLTLKQVADEIGVHETTISRITSGKYIDTDYGILPLKTLFAAAIQSKGDEEGISRNAVKDMVKEIIESNSGKPLSDQKISDMLKEKGITCARRTVSKYRKELDIDSSFVRGN